MKKTICIYHSRDLDGWMSAAIVKKWHLDYLNSISDKIEKVNTLDFLDWDYGDEIPDLSDYDKVIMCDISFLKEEMEKLRKRLKSNFIWIDHHISAIKETGYINNRLYCNGLRDINFAACELTWKYFFPDEEVPRIVELLGLYDSFRHKGTSQEQTVLEFQYGARAEMTDVNECYYNLVNVFDIDNNYIVQKILDKGKAIYTYLQTEAESIYKETFPIELYYKSEVGYTSVRFLCINRQRFNPINFGINYHMDGYDGFACFWYKDGKWQFSLYNDDGKTDVSKIAKDFGGGGHKGAAGFVFDDINKFLKNVKVN